MKRKLGVLVMFFIVALLVACGEQTESELVDLNPPNEIISDEGEQIVQTPEPTEILGYRAPFSGQAIAAQNDTRPIAVLINNLAPARPQSGLSEADVLWEVLAEGGITRIIAIFQSASEQEFDIGPVRSNRPYFIELADTYGAAIAHAGASNDAYAILQRQKKPYLDEITNAGSYFWRSSERKAPHNLYTNLTKLREGITKKGYDEVLSKTGYSFYTADELSSLTTGDIKHVQVKFQLKNYILNYQYDETTKAYLRSINDEPHKDKNNDQQLNATNLIFMQTKHVVLDSEGRLDVDLTSGGNALIIQQGQRIEGQWVASADGMIRFVKDGEEIKLVPGQHFIHILPNEKQINEHVSWE